MALHNAQMVILNSPLGSLIPNHLPGRKRTTHADCKASLAAEKSFSANTFPSNVERPNKRIFSTIGNHIPGCIKTPTKFTFTTLKTFLTSRTFIGGIAGTVGGASVATIGSLTFLLPAFLLSTLLLGGNLPPHIIMYVYSVYLAGFLGSMRGSDRGYFSEPKNSTNDNMLIRTRETRSKFLKKAFIDGVKTGTITTTFIGSMYLFFTALTIPIALLTSSAASSTAAPAAPAGLACLA